MPIPDSIKIEKFDTVLFDMIGGVEVAEYLVQFHSLPEDGGGMSYRAIAEYHGEHPENVRRKIMRARVRMRRCGVWPSQWEKQGAEVAR